MIASSLHLVPTEILDDIFSYLEYNDVLQCQLTCKRWSGQATQRILYKNVTSLIKDKRLDCFVRTISTSTSQPGEFVKFLDLSSLFPKQYMTEDIMKTIGKYCPNVERILGYDMSDLFWTSITVGRSLGYWSYIKELPSPSFKHGFTPEIYFDTILACSNSLDTLEFYFHSYVGTSSLLKTAGITKRLKHDFSRLQKVQFREVHGTDKGISQFDHIINQCPKLVQTLSFNKCYDNILSSRHQSEQSLHNSSQTDNTTAEIFIIPCTTIKHLTVKSCSFSKESIEYLMKKFPEFEAIDIFYSWEGFFLLSKPAIFNFFKYVSNIPTFNLSGITNTENGEDICRLVTIFIDSTASSEKPIFINADLAYHYDQESNFNNVISSLKITNTKIQSTTTATATTNEQPMIMESTKKAEKVVDLHLRFYSHYINITRSRRIMNETIWRQSGKRLHKLCLSPNVQTFETSWDTIRRPIHDYKLNREGLGLIFECCTSLVELELTRTNLLVDNSSNNRREPIITNKSISKLILTKCWFQSSVLSEISNRLTSVTHVTVDSCIFINPEKNDDFIHIEMPHTNFHLLYLKWADPYADIWKKYKDFYTKLTFPYASSTSKRRCITQQNQCLFGNKSIMKPSTLVKYRVALLEPTSLAMNVECKDISVFKFQIDGYPEINYRMKERCTK